MEKKRTIKINFLDYWSGFNPASREYLIQRILDRQYDVVICDDADYVFYSAFGSSHWKVPDHCLKIFHTGENLVPDFNACDYAIAFEWMDYGDRYIRFPLYLFYDPQLLDRMVHKHEIPSGWNPATEKSGFCSFVVSNPLNPRRNEAFQALSTYKQVDSGGRYMNNVGGPVADKFAFESKHKFSLCFENGSHSGYTTEKLVEALAARTIPIYWGDPDIGKVFNPKAFIDVSSFRSMDEVVRRVKEIDNDDHLYLQMLREPSMRPDAPSLEEEMKRFEQWLLHIFEQPLSQAYRRNREFFGKRYIEQQRALTRWERFRQRIKK